MREKIFGLQSIEYLIFNSTRDLRNHIIDFTLRISFHLQHGSAKSPINLLPFHAFNEIPKKNVSKA